MRKLTKFYWILTMSLVVGFGLISCSSDDDDDGSSNNNNGGVEQTDTYKMTAKVNDATFSATTVSGDLVSNKFSLRGRAEGLAPAIFLDFPASVEVGETYTLSSNGDYYAMYMSKDGMQIAVSTGSMTVTEYNKTTNVIKGTFLFTVEATMVTPKYVITEGSFSCKYSVLD